MNKKIMAVIFAAALTIGVTVISQAEEQSVSYDEAVASGSAVETSYGESVEEKENTEASESEESAEISEHGSHRGAPGSGFKHEEPLPTDDINIKNNKNEEDTSGSDGEEASDTEKTPDNEADTDEKSADDNVFSDSDNDSEETEPRSSGGGSDKEKLPPPPEEREKAEFSGSEKSSTGSGNSSSGKKYLSDDSTEAELTDAEAAEITEDEALISSEEPKEASDKEVLSGEELMEQADLQGDVITFEKNGTGLEIPSGFIEQNNIGKDDIVSVSINRTESAVDVSVQVNDEEIEEIEGAKIILPGYNGTVDSFPADNLGEIYISGAGSINL
ncbi:MAG: hypothetical protein LUC97_10995 [Clostridiales bacterium]|nr:hypothetical protein [Clostridiales bacterium]